MAVRTAAAVALLVCAGCGSGGYSSGTPKAAPSETTPVVAPVANAMTIRGYAWDPSPLTVKPGATVTVTNKDSVDHTTTSDQAGLFSADGSAGSGPVTFTAPVRPGTYTFHCAIHASMHGTLVVQP